MLLLRRRDVTSGVGGGVEEIPRRKNGEPLLNCDYVIANRQFLQGYAISADAKKKKNRDL